MSLAWLLWCLSLVIYTFVRLYAGDALSRTVSNYNWFCLVDKMENRMTLKQQDPNPLFTKWLTEWLEYAKRKDSLRKHSLVKALDSLSKYPLVLENGHDCSILDGFGSKICLMLDRQLKLHFEHQIAPELEIDLSIQDVIKNAHELYVKSKELQKEPTQEVPSLVIISDSFEIILLVDTQETAG